VTVNDQAARMLPGSAFEATIPLAAGSNTVSVVARDGSGNARTSTYAVDLGEAGTSYTYDANGSLATKVEAGSTWTYTFDAERRLTRVEKDAVEVARFGYDPLGRRVEKVAAGTTIAYVYDDLSILKETNSSSGPVRYVHAPGIDEPLIAEKFASGAVAYYHADGLGSIVSTSDAGGSVSSSRRYDAWGTLEVGDDQPGYAFTGREWDPETGLYYYRARYYDPKLGRFLSEDPLRFANGASLYPYVLNNPVNFLDPFGFYSCPLPLCNGKIEKALREKAKLYCQVLSDDASEGLRKALTEPEFNELKKDETSSLRGAEILEDVATRLLTDPSVPRPVKDEIRRFLANKETLRDKAKQCDTMRSQGNKNPKPPCP
jgi:RHS repeat-associated protein